MKDHVLGSKEVTHRMIVTNQMHRRMLEYNLENSGIHRGQHRMLMTLSEKPFASQVELARYLEVSPATIAVSLKALKKKGLIVQKIREEDNRRNFVELTEKGRKHVEESCEFFDTLDQQMYQGFTEEEKQRLCEYLDRIYANMERLAAQAAAANGCNKSNNGGTK